MVTKSRNINVVSSLRLLAILITLLGALLTYYGVYYGLVKGLNFPYAFEPPSFAASSTLDDTLRRGYNAAKTLARTPSVQVDEQTYQFALSSLSFPHPYLYYVSGTDTASITNLTDVSDIEVLFSNLPAHRKVPLSEGRTVYVGLSPETFALLAQDFAQKRASGIRGLSLTLAGLLAGMLGLGYVMYSAGKKKPNSTEVHLSFRDRIYLDVGLAIFSGWSVLAVTGMLLFLNLYDRDGTPIFLATGALLAVLTTLAGLQYFSSVAKRLKRGELIKHTLTYTALDTALARVVNAGPLEVRASGLLLGYGAALSISLFLMASASGTWSILLSFGLFALVNVLGLWFVVSRVTELKAIITGTERIKSGDLAHRIPESGAVALAGLASNINNIALGLQAAVESEVKAERMKAELVTNVSHDLKTPLTSIITYVDLLKTEGLTSENAPKYLDVLDKKSQRLKVLTEDLFEAAKAATGNLPVTREALDVGALLTQGLAELSDRIETSGLDFRVNIPKGRIEILADGKLVWRALDNILSNVLNYALVGSRVYIDVTVGDGLVLVTCKNISATPLNIKPEELLERFKRGDESRSTPGSGLGLAIAKSLVELQNGSFHIDIDGDLFKVTMSFPAH